MTETHKIGFLVKQQAPGRRRYALHGGKLCSCCLTNPPVKNHGYCKDCKRLYEKARRARLNELGKSNLSKGDGNDERSDKGGPIPAARSGP